MKRKPQIPLRATAFGLGYQSILSIVFIYTNKQKTDNNNKKKSYLSHI